MLWGKKHNAKIYESMISLVTSNHAGNEGSEEIYQNAFSCWCLIFQWHWNRGYSYLSLYYGHILAKKNWFQMNTHDCNLLTPLSSWFVFPRSSVDFQHFPGHSGFGLVVTLLYFRDTDYKVAIQGRKDNFLLMSYALKCIYMQQLGFYVDKFK